MQKHINNKLLFSAREKKVLYSFKSRRFPIRNLDKTPARESTTEPTTEPEIATKAKAKTKHKISLLKFTKNF